MMRQEKIDHLEMEQSRNILCDINVSTKDLKMQTIQDLLALVRHSKSNFNKAFWEEVALKLWQHLEEGFCKVDNQLLCATCFYSVISLAQKEDYYLDKILQVIRSDTNLKENTSGSEIMTVNEKEHLQEKQKLHMLQMMSLMYGMFQSSFLTQRKYNDESIMTTVLKEVFNVLVNMGYEYSQFTFLAFKTIKSFNKLCGGPLEHHIYCKENQVRLLVLVNNNWENPITGVRDLNRSIFQNVLSTLGNETYQCVMEDIDGFYWNKAKFLMLSEVIEIFNDDVMLLVCDKWVDGLIYSLHKPGLVTAGADMYYALLKKINKQNDWCELFLSKIVNMLNGTSTKAIENFTNYWCIATMKKFDTIIHVLFHELEVLKDSEQLLYSKLSIMKQANKLGILDRDWYLHPDHQNAVMTGIEHSKNYLRMLAFDIVCVSQGKVIPSPYKYNLILNYLSNNVNSDSTVLRLSMFSSFNNFLVQLHFTFLNVMIKDETSQGLDNLITFLNALQLFILNNLNINGNYQRKITNVKLCNSILTNLNEIPKKRKDQTKQVNITLINYLKQRNYWLLSTKDFIKKLLSLLKDPSDDIRENATKILLYHYVDDLKDVTVMSHIINEAKKSMQSKFFFEISCGQSMFKLLINLLIKEKNYVQAEYKNVEDVFNFAYNDLIAQHATETNVLESIENGKQLHSFISTLIVILEECTSNSYKINIDGKMTCLLNVLESISKQFAWEEEGSTDFSKINDMVQNIILSADCNSVCQDGDHTKISGLQQIVLNCLWLSVKASCDLASLLVQYNESNISMCEKCLNIITGVLETSRHKGAIEAAGAALGRGIQYLTSIPEKKSNTLITSEEKILEENDVSKLPLKLLEHKLNDLISETNKMSSITRRGAGLSIMVHRIVSSDMKKGKPLFHYFIKTLLQTCNNEVPTCISRDMDNQVDLPKAIYIHFLTKIVTDSSLATDMMYYSVELAELAFMNLTSSHWQIRNAALQLYGALIPRLIGQKKASGTDEETVATVACDELRTHLPKLWGYIIEQLKQNQGTDRIQTHSNLVPILNMLASSAKRYNLSLHKEGQTQYNDLLSHFLLLLGSPIYTVRRLTAKAIFNIFEFKFISAAVLKQLENITENMLHGILILVNILHKYYASKPEFENGFRKLSNKFCQIFTSGTHSYLNKQLLEDIYGISIDMKGVEYTFLELNSSCRPGVQSWAESRLKKYINDCSGENIVHLLRTLLEQCGNENYYEMILLKLQTQKHFTTDTLLDIAVILMTNKNKMSGSVVWKIIYLISQSIELHDYLNDDDLWKKLDGRVPYNLRYIVPLLARNIGNASVENQIRLMTVIDELSDFENSDVDMRYIAAISNNEIAQSFNKIPDSLKVISVKCAVLLLQDEDEDVRNLNVKFYSILNKENRIYQPYICLHKILSKSFLDTIFNESQRSIQEVSTRLHKVILNTNHVVDNHNPFANDCKNIYFEHDVLKQLVDKLNIC